MFNELFEQKKSYRRYTTPAWLSYGRVDYEKIKDIPTEEFKAFEAEWTETEKFNNDVKRHNRALQSKAAELFVADLKSIGVVTHGVRGGLLKQFATVLREIEYKLSGGGEPAFPRAEFFINGQKVGNYIGTISENLIALKRSGDYQAMDKERKSALFVASMKYLIEHKLSIPAEANVIGDAHHHATTEYEKTMIGKTIDISCCSECDEWTVGEHRCSCGNRRMSLSIEGDIVSGLYSQGEAG